MCVSGELAGYCFLAKWNPRARPERVCLSAKERNRLSGCPRVLAGRRNDLHRGSRCCV